MERWFTKDSSSASRRPWRGCKTCSQATALDGYLGGAPLGCDMDHRALLAQITAPQS